MDRVLGQDEVISFLQSRIQSPPHFILSGPTGTGKTMLANAFVQEQLAYQGITEPAKQAIMTLRLTSADDRGITAIRQNVMEFVRRVRPVPGTTAWVIIDDADNLPTVTQQALRRILELHAKQAYFFFISQNIDKFIEPIQSRCVVLKTAAVDLEKHGPELMSRELSPTHLTEDAQHLMASLCQGNARQFILLCRAVSIAFDLPAPADVSATKQITATDIQPLINAPPVKVLLALQDAVIQRNLPQVTENCLSLWSRGYSFEECIAMLEQVVRIYNPEMTEELQYVLQCCAEGHIYQILNKTTTIDLIAVLSGRVSSEGLG
jgi:DNA polymerase III gamma/tau subunit